MNMEELKEKIAVTMRLQEYRPEVREELDKWHVTKWDDLHDITRSFYRENAAEILTLFQNWLKEQVEGLEVMSDEEIDAILDKHAEDEGDINWENHLLQAQLKDVKDKLLRGME